MRIYVTSTPDELAPYQRAVCDVAREAGAVAVLRDPTPSLAFDPVRGCARQVAGADLLLALVGWRRGPVPRAAEGGDDLRPWAAWEVESAFEQGVPVKVLMASEDWPQREDGEAARAAVSDLRGELGRLAVSFDPEDDGLEVFRGLVRDLLRSRLPGAPDGGRRAAGLELRRWPPPELPELPYPLLLPYTHPDLLAGRDRDLAELDGLLERPVLVTGVHAVSGIGKSSFLFAGLVQRRRREGRPVAYDREPWVPGAAGRWLRQLTAGEPRGPDPAGDDPRAFVDALAAVHRLAEAPPVVVLDQVEDLFRRRHASRARAVLGTLLAASAQRVAGLDGPPCRWLLAYRQEFHGDVFAWLGDVLRDAGREGITVDESLPRDLSGIQRFQDWPLPPLGTPPPGTENVARAATEVFLQAVEAPLARGSYPWRFAAGGAERLARAFGEARARDRDAPLAPELQVVLAHLLEEASEPLPGETAEIEVGQEPGERIGEALEDHLRRALDRAFPTAGKETRIERTRAILALRELADDDGRRGEGLPEASLARAIGEEGRDVLERLATAGARLVVPERRGGELSYRLAHDRLAEVLVRWVDEGQYARLGVDRELLELRRFVELQSELFAAGESGPATRMHRDRFARIERHREALVWGEKCRRWWTACRARRRSERRRAWGRRLGAALAVLAVGVGAWAWTDRQERRRTLFEEVAKGQPEAAFAAVHQLFTQWRAEPEELQEALRERLYPFDVMASGLGGVDPEGREEAVLRVAELLLPLILVDAPEDPLRIAPLVWALDFFAPRDERRRTLRDQVLEPLRRKRPPPPLPPPPRPGEEDPQWVDVPAGTFWMGTAQSEGQEKHGPQDLAVGLPRHRVTLSAFRIGRYEVTNREWRRLWPKHGYDKTSQVWTYMPYGQDDQQPAVFLNWAEAYTYAAWLGGRLPTEAEAEYVRRGGCEHFYCRSDGSEARPEEVMRMQPIEGRWVPDPVGQLEPTPWGLFDLYGNVAEHCADWYGEYSAEDQTNPPGPTSDLTLGVRVSRGPISDYPPPEGVDPAALRIRRVPVNRTVYIGLRVVLEITDGARRAAPTTRGRG